MTKSGILETRSRLSQIVNAVMHGDEHIILRKNVAVAKIVPIEENLLVQAKELIKETLSVRASIKKISIDEIINWNKAGRK